MEKLELETIKPFNRRDLFKTGLVVAGGLVLPTACTGPEKRTGQRVDHLKNRKMK